MTFYAPHQQQTAVTDLRPVAAIVRSAENDRVNDSISYQPDNKWRAFVDGLAGNLDGLDRAHVDGVKAVWDNIKQSFSVPVPLPLTQPTNGGNVQLSWDTGHLYLELEVLPNGQLEWFFRNRDTNELDGTRELPEDSIGSSFLSRLSTILHERRT